MCESYLEENWQSSLPTLYDSHQLCPLLHPPTPEMRISVKCPAHMATLPQTCHVCGRIPPSSQAFNMPASLSPAPWNSGLSLIISKSEGRTPNTTPIWYQRAATELPSIFCISLTDSSKSSRWPTHSVATPPDSLPDKCQHCGHCAGSHPGHPHSVVGRGSSSERPAGGGLGRGRAIGLHLVRK